MKSVAGGVWIFLGVVIGVVAGWFIGQPSLGLIVGLIAGIAIATFVTIRDVRNEQRRGE